MSNKWWFYTGVIRYQSEIFLQLPPFAFGALEVRRLVLSNNSLAEVAIGAFAGGTLYDSLEELELSHNRLRLIPLNGVGELRALRSLVLADNEITSVADHTFLHYYSRKRLEK